MPLCDVTHSILRFVELVIPALHIVLNIAILCIGIYKQVAYRFHIQFQVNIGICLLSGITIPILVGVEVFVRVAHP
ncbi:hypothetical protein SDC9_208147 [bioreactor metagenome]|uniref:Uncharacterized protein n=1 Tax=bioreactor metagenome TaxID=1076179 RepID=A0A645JCE5_9ZZZZ